MASAEGPYQDLWARNSGTFCPANPWQARRSDNLKIRRFSEGLFSLYDGLVRLPNAMPGQRAGNPSRRNRCLPRWEARRSGGRPELRRGVSCEGHPRGSSLGPQARAIEAAVVAPGPERPADIARSGAPRSATATGLGLTRFSATGHPRDILERRQRRRQLDSDPLYHDACATPGQSGQHAIRRRASSKPSPDTASAADQIFACRELRLHSKRDGVATTPTRGGAS